MKISAIITLKKDVLDPQGKVIQQALDGMGFKDIIYLIILLTLVYMSKQKVWSRFGASKDQEEEETYDKVEKVVTKYEGEDPKTFK